MSARIDAAAQPEVATDEERCGPVTIAGELRFRHLHDISTPGYVGSTLHARTEKALAMPEAAALAAGCVAVPMSRLAALAHSINADGVKFGLPAMADFLRYCATLVEATPATPAPAMPPNIADDEVNAHLEKVLRASGSALRHFTMHKTLSDMRGAMRAAMVAVTPSALSAPAPPLLTDAAIDAVLDALNEVAKDEDPFEFGLPLCSRRFEMRATVREACGAGITAALAATPITPAAPVPSPPLLTLDQIADLWDRGHAMSGGWVLFIRDIEAAVREQLIDTSRVPVKGAP